MNELKILLYEFIISIFIIFVYLFLCSLFLLIFSERDIKNIIRLNYNLIKKDYFKINIKEFYYGFFKRKLRDLCSCQTLRRARIKREGRFPLTLPAVVVSLRSELFVRQCLTPGIASGRRR